VRARVLAFVGVFVGGLAGAIVGYAFATLQCSGGGCTLSRGLFLWLGSLAGSLGAATVGVITLRAFGEWRTFRD
jgi:hypothetical protein